MSDTPKIADIEPLRKYIHDLNNRVAVVLANAELLQLEQLSPKAAERRAMIEEKTIELLELLRVMSHHYFD